ncbi:monovalent cation/H(+) antiporter subunit G [Streptomyces sp. NPDC004031]
MSATHVLALALLWCGAAALLLAAVALAVLPTAYGRLHALAPATGLGVPLLCLGLAVDAGAGRAAVKLLVVGALTAVSGPVVTIVIGRTMIRTGAAPAPATGARTDQDGAAEGEPPT